MRALVLGLLAMGAAGCGDCLPDCALGYEPVPHTCSCRPLPDAGTTDAPKAEPLASCAPAVGCVAGARCVEGCPRYRVTSSVPPVGVCTVPGRDSCGCGVVADPCETPGTFCLMPACCDFEGICVTAEERAAICARPEGAHFDCTTTDAAPCDADLCIP
jgi:hypothetical protein